MQAIIMAGGKGRRLHPYTAIFPKPLMPIGEIPILEVVLRQLKFYGFKRVTLAVGYLAELIETYFGNGEKRGLDIQYSREEKNLGTIGPLSLIKDDLEESFLVLNGDILTDLNFRMFYSSHRQSKSLVTIASYNKKIKINLGVLEVNHDNILTDYIEKPVINYQVSMGIYVMEKEILDYIPYNEYFDVPSLMLKLLKEDKKPQIFSFSGKWLDIGRKEDYEKAVDEFEANKPNFLPE